MNWDRKKLPWVKGVIKTVTHLIEHETRQFGTWDVPAAALQHSVQAVKTQRSTITVWEFSQP